MIYLIRGIDFAICEREASAQAYEARGFRRCEYAELRAAWKARDERNVPIAAEETAPIGGDVPQVSQFWSVRKVQP